MKKRISFPIIALCIGILYGIFSSRYLLELDLNPQKMDLDFFYIFNNNAMILVYMLLGTLTFGIYTLFILFINGISLGVLFHEFYGTDLAAYVFVNTFPHGIVEIGGFLLAACGDLYIVKYLVLSIRKYIFKKTAFVDKKLFQRGLLLNFVSLGIIVTAAVIEVYLV